MLAVTENLTFARCGMNAEKPLQQRFRALQSQTHLSEYLLQFGGVISAISHAQISSCEKKSLLQ